MQGKFDPREHLMQIKSGYGDKAKSSDYLQVMWRLVWFRVECPEGSIETEIVLLDPDKECQEEASVWNPEKRRSEKVMKTACGIAVFKATVKDGKGGIATGTKMEKAASFNDYLEKAETGAIGRALASLGYGTQFTGDEFDEKARIVDSPVDPQQPAPSPTPAPRQAQQCQPVPTKPHNVTEISQKPVPNAPVSSQGVPAPATIPTPTQLRATCEALFGESKWEATLKRIFNKTYSDEEMTPEICSRLKRQFDIVAQRRAANQQAS